jgi:DNA-binding CsgD family transcriptional regulator
LAPESGARRRRPLRRQPAGLLQCNLLKEGPLTVALSLRGDRSGPATAEERRRIGVLAGEARAALRTRARLERQAAGLLIAAMDYAGTPAFILGRDGRCLDMTPQAQAIVAEGDCLRLVGGRLQTARAEETPDLARAIAQVTRADGAEAPEPRLVRASALSKGPPVLLEVFPAPPLAHGFSLSLGGVVVLRQQMLVDDRVAELARTLFGLTAAEARVAALMVGGGSVASIAQARGVGFETARTHVRSILAKSGVRRQAEFVAKMCRYR